MGKNKQKHKKSDWKSYQNSTKSKKQVLLGLGALLVIVLIVILAKAISFLIGINSPFSPQDKNTPVTYSTTSSTLTIAVKSQNYYLMTINPVAKKLTLIRLSPEIYLSNKKLGEISSGLELSQSLQKAFGVYIDGYLIFPDSASKFEDFAQDLRHGMGMLYLLQKVKTNLSLMGLININLSARSIRDNNFNITDLSNSNATRWQTLKDGSRVLQVDQSNLDRNLNGVFEDSKMSLEGLNIAVFNSTDHPGLAEKAARQITNMGGRVVSTDTIKSPQEKSIVFGKDSYTLSRLSFIYRSNCKKNIFGNGCAKIASELNKDSGFEVGISKADVVVVLGEDFYKD